ncbi:MAG: class I poly(R)-hydroxyalkanoic acid synthase [Ottowia sp.]|nr:class I poly(R)-hydroxyalkanoic acid synthase [Ottowia sp.]
MGSQLQAGWQQALEQLQQLSPAASGEEADAGSAETPRITFAPDELLKLQQEYMSEATQLWNQSLQSSLTLSDRRFSGEAWERNPMAAFTAAVYLLNGRTLMSMVDAAQTDAKTKARLQFAVEQWIAASAPSNFLTLNVEAQKKAVETGGKSLARGLQNMLADIRQGRVSMTDESVFELGKNVATTEGAVVFENELFQLLEYKPLTEKIYERPLLMVPPCINKYYILDLRPDNSLIRHAVEQGHRTFVVSWRNPDQSLANATWDDYIDDAVIQAIKVVQEIGNVEQINALGFCVGGTMLTTALAVLAGRGEDRVKSATLLTTLVDFTDSGILDVFIDENMVRYREMEMGAGGILKGRELATTFSYLRPNDLVWNYVVGNYLKGETPPPFDLLYWNSDSTNLPGPYYVWYLRNTYLENRLIEPGAVTVCGQEIDLNQVALPVYIYGSQRDHIVPIGGAYATTQVLPGDKRFVMGASGHIAGVINPPAAGKRNHWTREDNAFPESVDAWLDGAKKEPGSWWPDWDKWLLAHAGKEKAAPKRYGRASKYKKIEPAPGSYVKVKAE